MKNRLRVLRAERAWSQAELADRLGVSRQTVNFLETGKYDPSLPLAFKIAQLFKQPIEEIFDPGKPVPRAADRRKAGAAG
jgi:putative transcriptional regulator